MSAVCALLLSSVLCLSGCTIGKQRSTPVPAPSASVLFREEVHDPPTLGFIESRVRVRAADGSTSEGTERVACVTCHSLKPKAPLPESAGALQAFHRGLTLKHGTLQCAACHQADATHRLHRADGTVLDPSQALELCAQCHGLQYRDYQHGAHGGMVGYWDLRRGPRSRNHCVDCHEPHAPAFQPMHPVLPPRDRFLEAAHEGGR